MNKADIRQRARGDLHKGLSEPVLLRDDDGAAVLNPLTEDGSFSGRWHNRLRISGEATAEWAGVVEGLDFVVFDRAELTGVDLARGWTVEFPALNKTLTLEYEVPDSGPVTVKWSVVHRG